MKNKGIGTAVIVIIVVVVVAGGIGGYMVMSGGDSGTPEDGGGSEGPAETEEDTGEEEPGGDLASLYLVASGQDTESEWEGEQKIWIRKTGPSAIDSRMELYKDGELALIDILNYEEKKGYAYYPKLGKWESKELTTENIEKEVEEHLEPYLEIADNYDEGDQYMRETIKWEIMTIEEDIEIGDDKFTPPEDADL